jgi:hypothetical protein
MQQLIESVDVPRVSEKRSAALPLLPVNEVAKPLPVGGVAEWLKGCPLPTEAGRRGAASNGRPYRDTGT